MRESNVVVDTRVAMTIAQLPTVALSSRCSGPTRPFVFFSEVSSSFVELSRDKEEEKSSAEDRGEAAIVE